ncbi:Dbl homology domain-containing protein [Chytridium lagenaria]|nr:Dbl homology domain-containing protein [Chytridium lagenaria]
MELLKLLETRQSESENNVVEQVGDIFIRVSDYLKMYAMYCSNHPYAVMKLQALRNAKAIAKFLDQCASMPESRSLGLQHFLLKPIQRICKYPLFLRELIKNTESDHPDSANLIKALLKIETVVTIVNEGARQAEGVHKMLELQNRFVQSTLLLPLER